MGPTNDTAILMARVTALEARVSSLVIRCTDLETRIAAAEHDGSARFCLMQAGIEALDRGLDRRVAEMVGAEAP